MFIKKHTVKAKLRIKADTLMIKYCKNEENASVQKSILKAPKSKL